MNAHELFRTGRLADALKALSAEVRDNPTDARRRTFLFELLCFAGEYERADKQLEVLGQAGPSSEIGVLIYRSALYAERQRQDLFTRGEFPKASDAPSAPGTFNGKPYRCYVSYATNGADGGANDIVLSNFVRTDVGTAVFVW